MPRLYPHSLSRRTLPATLTATGALALSLVAAPVAHAAEPEVVSYTAGIATEVHDATTGAVLAPGEIEAGDLIEYQFGLTNDGNVTLDGVLLCQTWGDGLTDYRKDGGAGVTPGDDLSTSSISAFNYRSRGWGVFGNFSAYKITEADLDRGWAELDSFYVHAAPESPLADCDAASAPGSGAQRIVPHIIVRELAASVEMTLQDTNGDGVGQEGEQVEITWTATNLTGTGQAITIDRAQETGNAPALGTVFDGVTLDPGASTAHSETFAITAAMESAGSLDAAVEFDYTGLTDDEQRTSETATATSVPTGAYVRPDNGLDLDLEAVYADANGDGAPSIGETATITVTVTNIGLNTLTDVTVANGAAADVAGLPSIRPYDTPSDGVQAWQFTHLLTAADFARGSILFAAEVTSNEIWNPIEASASLTPITFAAYEDDLEPGAAGGIAVCSPAGEPVSEASPGDPIVVTPDDCAYAGASEGYRVVMASTPTVLSTGAFAASVPTDAELGAHRIGLYGPDGALIGWQALEVVAASESEPDPQPQPSAGGELPSTGFGSAGLAGGAAALVLLGAGAMGLRRRFA
ncbi:hypothetical protein [Demequina sp. NBRC 110052]|uniref:hypothetical protein n=1 Tax=Demequina sp. NBRC 110052 TaxID=1570341 RepID=UPI001F1FAB4E|nr:hypothetical protein [Demequina sp. NBRC 110052]